MGKGGRAADARVAHAFCGLVALFQRDELSFWRGLKGGRRLEESSRRWNTVATTRGRVRYPKCGAEPSVKIGPERRRTVGAAESTARFPPMLQLHFLAHRSNPSGNRASRSRARIRSSRRRRAAFGCAGFQLFGLGKTAANRADCLRVSPRALTPK